MKVTDTEAIASIQQFLKDADLDDLASIYSRYCADGKIRVGDTVGISDLYEDGNRVNG